MSDWRDNALARPPLGALGWLRVALRGGLMGAVIYSGLLLLLLLRLIERPLFGPARPWTPHITQMVCKLVFPIIGLRLITRGQPMPQKGAVVANHASWLDIFALNAAQRGYFVAKSEVEHWAAIGWLARATGTVFVARKGTEAKRQQVLFEERLRAGHRLMFFPEGTSTDAIRVLPFKSTLFAAFFTHGLDHILHIQPVSVIYHAPPGQDARFYGWWGEMDFAPHLLQVLAAPRQGRVEVVFHPPVAVSAFANRKELAAYCESVIRASHPLAVSEEPSVRH
ncbi:MAG: 1-acyl-sn-glycerol-3-phosphate acyltransferase [Pseudorhodobacter sp. PARRP1]|nr:MAG: 1-acyl-sn-glycerol-3-phosphate acyltransferase [Pseudorhodobacter sp. PARRP1]